MGHLTDSDQCLPLCQCDGVTAQNPHKVHGTTVEALTGADRPRQRAPPSFPPTVIRLKSTRVTGGPFTGEFLADHYRDISFYDEYVFPVTCERMGFPASEIRELVSTKAAGESKGAEERSQNRSST